MSDNCKKDENQENIDIHNNSEGFQVQEMQQENRTGAYIGAGGSTLAFAKLSPCFSPVHILSPAHTFSGSDIDLFHLQPPPTFGDFIDGRGSGSQFGYNGQVLDRRMKLISESLVRTAHPNSVPLGLQAELPEMSSREIMDAKALAASKSHSEAERRRRERINTHLAKLRSLLPTTIKNIKRLRTVKAEIDTLGDRVKNVLYISRAEEDHQDSNNGNSGFEQQHQPLCVSSIQEALQAVIVKCNGSEYGTSGSVKRQRTDLNILKQSCL